MEWIDEVRRRLEKNNSVLFAKDSAYLQDLFLLFQGQPHRVMALWAFGFAAESVARLEEKYPEEIRPREALEAAQGWAVGRVKMRQAQRKILDCHAFAKEIDCKEDIATCHAVGQACAVVHTAGHVIGYPIYDLTSIIYKVGVEKCSGMIESRKQEYIDRLFYWGKYVDGCSERWADFMLR